MITKILIVTFNQNWSGISRLPSGLSKAGFEVYALCPQKSLIAKTKFLKGSIKYPTLTYSRSKLIYLLIIFSYFFYRPQILIPGDEDTIKGLQQLNKLIKNIPLLKKLSQLIEASLPEKNYHSLILTKSLFQNKCREWGLRTPKNVTINSLPEALNAANEMGYPVVLKYDSSYGGSGVTICKNSDDIKNSYIPVKKISLSLKIKNYIKNLLFISIFNNDNSASIQKYIDGIVGQAPFCSKNGKLLAFNPMLRLESYPNKTGPSSVNCGLINKDITHFVETVVKNLKYNGFGSLEYILEKSSDLIYIIELNPRPTPTTQLNSKIVPNDLCEIYFKAVNNQQFELHPYRPYTVAMFPSEIKRDPNSQYLKEGFHDIPTDDPDLLDALKK